MMTCVVGLVLLIYAGTHGFPLSYTVVGTLMMGLPIVAVGGAALWIRNRQPPHVEAK